MLEIGCVYFRFLYEKQKVVQYVEIRDALQVIPINNLSKFTACKISSHEMEKVSSWSIHYSIRIGL